MSAGDAALEDAIFDRLTSNGTFDAIKRELKVAVDTAVDDYHGNSPSSSSNHGVAAAAATTKAVDIGGDPEGQLGLSLVKDFLHCFSLGETLSVLNAETSSSTAPPAGAEVRCASFWLSSRVLPTLLA